MIPEVEEGGKIGEEERSEMTPAQIMKRG